MAASVIQERLSNLRKQMKDRGIDVYLVPTSDFHSSEYVSDYFKCRQYLTGFTGSAGTAVITAEECCLWTDGRYFVQAAGELAGTEIILQRMGKEGVPTISEYLKRVLPENGCLGFDGRVADARLGRRLEQEAAEKGAVIHSGEDLCGIIWKERPPLPARPIWILPEEYAGEAMSRKLSRVRQEMVKKGAQVHLLASLDDIAWILNLRGSDVACTPVMLSYLLITEEETMFFAQKEAVGDEIRDYLERGGVRLKDYHSIYEEIKGLESKRILLETDRINYAMLQSLPESAKVIDEMNPSSLMKAIKNETEIRHIKAAHKKDGAVMVRFLRWLKQQAAEGCRLDEYAAGRYLDHLREKQEGYLDLSFDTISAYGSNAAMCHYSASEDQYAEIQPKSFYLVDSGGQYLDGTTDVTRTVALGPLSEKEKKYFTLVACSMLRLLDAEFPYGARGVNIDYAARELLWKQGLDFNHGTGHGVGFVGGVHERPNSIRWRIPSGTVDSAVFEEGMVTSNEPGLYLEGEFGIRTENLMLCVKAEKTEFGQFMKFENLTWVPIDLDAIDPAYMEPSDIERLNAYHKQVYENLSPLLTEEEREWLKWSVRQV